MPPSPTPLAMRVAETAHRPSPEPRTITARRPTPSGMVTSSRPRPAGRHRA